jgi:hypothetical protein
MPRERERWRSRRVGVPLPRDVFETMWRRASQWDVAEGGRFDIYPNAILLWSRGFTIEPNEPVGVLAFRRHPLSGGAAIHHIAWNEGQGGSEAQIWRAIELLVGPASSPLLTGQTARDD